MDKLYVDINVIRKLDMLYKYFHDLQAEKTKKVQLLIYRIKPFVKVISEYI